MYLENMSTILIKFFVIGALTLFIKSNLYKFHKE